MSAANANTPKRDNLFGVCAAIGEDFGFDPFYLRVALAVGVIASPAAVLIGYAAAALLVVLSRVLVRSRRAPARSGTIHAIAARPTTLDMAEPELMRAAA